MKTEVVVTNVKAVVMKTEVVVTNVKAVVMKVEAVVIYQTIFRYPQTNVETFCQNVSTKN